MGGRKGKGLYIATFFIVVVGTMKRVVLLQTIATNSKNSRLEDFMNQAVCEYNHLLSERNDCKTFMQFHHKTLKECKIRAGFNIQVACSLLRDAWRKNAEKVDGLTVKFNVPRNCKTFNTKTNFFVEFGLYPRNRIAVPITQNRNYQRLQSLTQDGWTYKTYGLTKDLQVVAYLSKTKEIPRRRNVLGVDINAKHIAITVVTPEGKVLYQTYFGKRMWVKRKKIMARRSLLQLLNAKKKLRQLGHYERNYVKTELGHIIKEIVSLAVKYDADIAIEKLKRFQSKGRRFNRTVMRIPFYRFRRILEQRCFDRNIHLDVLDSWHTSKWCSHCGAVGKGHSANYSLFKCKCGQTVNSDRKASLAVAVKSLLERSGSNQFFQFSSRRVPVSGLIRPSEDDKPGPVNPTLSADGKPTSFSCG
jgi:IS605 OrfB family transposase